MADETAQTAKRALEGDTEVVEAAAEDVQALKKQKAEGGEAAADGAEAAAGEGTEAAGVCWVACCFTWKHASSPQFSGVLFSRLCCYIHRHKLGAQSAFPQCALPGPASAHLQLLHKRAPRLGALLCHHPSSWVGSLSACDGNEVLMLLSVTSIYLTPLTPTHFLEPTA